MIESMGRNPEEDLLKNIAIQRARNMALMQQQFEGLCKQFFFIEYKLNLIIFFASTAKEFREKNMLDGQMMNDQWKYSEQQRIEMIKNQEMMNIALWEKAQNQMMME